ncbi:PepSY domain-containing protein [Streptomyces sp. NPDC032940]|uniref:PepSY domain-containing protein n=1 Tax=Streptomyces sp. NPDC032940 TaxID=3155366 RepID=UPI00340EA402
MKRNIVIAAVTAAALIGGGTATALATTGDDDGGATPRADVSTSDVSVSDDGGVRDEADDRDDDAARAASAKVTAADAVAAALADTPGTAVSAELDDEDDDEDDDGDDRRERAAWEVDILADDGTRHSVRVDPAGGKVLGSERDDDEDDTAEVRAALKGASVDAAEAAKATAAAGHSTVTSVELDEDGHYGDGKPAWEVETQASGKSERDWRVDPRSGKVTADRPHDAHGSPYSDDDADDAGNPDDGDADDD